jgi:diguanylate cyclase (GGDEF)-like protein
MGDRMSSSQPVETGAGGLTGLVRSLVTSESLDVLSSHVLTYFQQSIASQDRDVELTELVVFRNRDAPTFQIYEGQGPWSGEFVGNEFSNEDWPEDLWESVATGTSVQKASIDLTWLGGKSDDLETLYLRSVPFKTKQDLHGFYLLIGEDTFELPDTFQYLSQEFGEIVGEILRFKRDSWQVEQRLETFETLDHFYEGLNRVESFEGILKFCLETFQDLFDAPEGSVMVYDREREVLRVRHSSTDVAGDPMEFELGEGVAGTALAEDELINLPDVKRSSYFKEFDEDLQLKSLLAVPLRTPRGPVGVVNLSDYEQHRSFDPDSIPGLEIMRSRVAAGLESVMMTRKLEKVANTDELTGLYNRRFIHNHLEDLMTEFKQSQTPFAVILIDLDDFKSINDEHGHQTGDKVLKKFANTLEKKARRRDLVGRFGGDEFIYVMPDTGPDRARSQADYIADRLDELVVETATGTRLNPTASLGLSPVHDGAAPESLESLIRSADRSLYRAKETAGVHLEIDSTDVQQE